MWRRLGVVAAIAIAATAMAPVPADAAGSRLVRIARGLNQPIYVAASPGDPNRLYVVLKGGVIRVMRNGNLQRRPVLDISGRVSRGGEEGLLSMAFDRRSAGRR